MYSLANPDTLVLCAAAAGSTLANLTNNSSGNYYYAYNQGAITNLNPLVYSRSILTGYGDNDMLAGGSVVSVASNFNFYYGNLLTNFNIAIDFYERRYTLNSTTAAYVANLWTWYSQMENTFPFRRVLREARYISPEYLATVSIDSPPCHFNALNAAGHNANAAEAMLFGGTPWPTYTSGTNLTVSGSPWLWTNLTPKSVVLNISGGTVSGVGKNGNAVNPYFVPLAFGDVIAITNSVAPVVWLDSSNP
jgi:hypothetical protein